MVMVIVTLTDVKIFWLVFDKIMFSKRDIFRRRLSFEDELTGFACTTRTDDDDDDIINVGNDVIDDDVLR